jgi:hypothetical protein
MTNFANYTSVLLSALENNPRSQEVVARKQDIIDSVYHFHNIAPASTLYVGFNPAVLTAHNRVVLTACTESVLTYLKAQSVEFEYVEFDQLSRYCKAFDSVVAFDEFFTFGSTDTEQQDNIQTICEAAKQVVISTVRDYKNQDFKEKEFSTPALIRNGGENSIYMEFHDWSIKDRASWSTMVYEIAHPTNTMLAHGPFDRRTMYFKQLAKFSMDAGATHFQVHKNLMYKSLIKKNYEHVISIIFE